MGILNPRFIDTFWFCFDYAGKINVCNSLSVTQIKSRFWRVLIFKITLWIGDFILNNFDFNISDFDTKIKPAADYMRQ